MSKIRFKGSIYRKKDSFIVKIFRATYFIFILPGNLILRVIDLFTTMGPPDLDADRPLWVELPILLLQITVSSLFYLFLIIFLMSKL